MTFQYGGDYDFYVRALEREQFQRIAQMLSCNYKHGTNISMRLDDIHRAETQLIENLYAPKTKRRRRIYRILLKSWLNATNPRWFTMKMVARLTTAERFWTSKSRPAR